MVRIRVYCPRCDCEEMLIAFVKLHLEGARQECLCATTKCGCKHQGMHIGIIGQVGRPLKE